MQGETNAAANVQRVSLVVIKRGKSSWQGKIGEASGNRTLAFRNLIGVGQVNLCPMRNQRRPQGEFPAPDNRFLNG